MWVCVCVRAPLCPCWHGCLCVQAHLVNSLFTRQSAIMTWVRPHTNFIHYGWCIGTAKPTLHIQVGHTNTPTQPGSCVFVCLHMLVCLLSKAPNQRPNLFLCAGVLCFFFFLKEPELSWRGGQKTDAQLWGPRWLTTVCHQSLCKHLWLRQQGTH